MVDAPFNFYTTSSTCTFTSAQTYKPIHMGDNYLLNVRGDCVYLDSVENDITVNSDRHVVGNINNDLLTLNFCDILFTVFGTTDFRYFIDNHLGFGDWQRKGEGAYALTKYTPSSLHPPEYRFDVSFWINNEFTEERFLDMVVEISENLVRSVRLVDDFTHPESGLVSHCYSLMYQSLDKPMGFSDAYIYYQYLRDQLAVVMHVTLR